MLREAYCIDLIGITGFIVYDESSCPDLLSISSHKNETLHFFTFNDKQRMKNADALKWDVCMFSEPHDKFRSDPRL